MNDPVLFDEIVCDNGKRIGVAILNSEKTLNSLSLPMIEQLTAQLEIWSEDDRIVLVMLEGAGDRAFSAGGDIQDLYWSMCERPGGPNPYAERFFEEEYRLDFMIHTFKKPIVVWAHGFVMGGGLGVMAACSHRIGTQASRVAMPEITIGLFPDAGATWFLARMESHLAYFLAWTGSHMNALDAKRVGFIDHIVPYERKGALIDELVHAAWGDDPQRLHLDLTDLIATFEDDSKGPSSVIHAHDSAIREAVEYALASDRPAVAFDRALDELDTTDKWLSRAIATYRSGCPVTAHLIHEQISLAEGLSLREIFMLELVMAIQCSRHPDFAEGIRALLVDRDGDPAWHFKHLDDVTRDWLMAHFRSPFEGQNPLANLPESDAHH